MHAKEEMAMLHRNSWLRPYRILPFLGLSLLALTVPLPVYAGGVHVSVGFELPVPVAVVPAPPPVVVAPAPVIVQRPPVVVQQPPVVIEERRVIYRDHLPPGLAKKVYGYDHGRWKHYHHHDD
jgi:hypothetical protein